MAGIWDMVIPARARVPALRKDCKARGTSDPAGAKIMAASRRLGGRIFGGAGPCGSKSGGECAVRWAAGENINLTAEMPSKLQDQMGRGAESVEPEALSFSNSTQTIRAIADDSSAEQRRSVLVRENLRN